MTINDNSTKSINAAIIDLQNQIKQLQHKIGILNKNQLKEEDIEFPGKVEYADEAGKAKEADHAKTADTAKYTSETENAVHAGYADNATKATQDGSGNVITDTYAKKSEVNDLIDDSKTDSAHTWSSEKIENRLNSKRVFPLYVDNDCKASDLIYFAMKNPDGWIDISLSKMTLRSTSIHNSDIIFKHKLGNYIKQMFPNGDPYRIAGSVDRFSYRQNTGFDLDISGLARTYFADGVQIEQGSGFDDVTGLFGINFRVYAPDYED